MANKDPDEYREYMRKYMNKRYHERRKRVLTFLGNKCRICGATDGKLDIDHIDPTQKSFSISKLWSIAEDRFWAEVVKCQLLCKSCHKQKTIKDRGFQVAKGRHGTISSYRYCKCDLCRRAWNKWNREYRRERRAKKKVEAANV